MPGKVYARADFLKQYTRQERLNRKVSALLALLWGTVWMGAGAAVLGNLVKMPYDMAAFNLLLAVGLLILLPLLQKFSAFCFQRALNRTFCPFCGKALTGNGLLLATCRCPACGRMFVEAEKEPVAGYELPPFIFGKKDPICAEDIRSLKSLLLVPFFIVGVLLLAEWSRQGLGLGLSAEKMCSVVLIAAGLGLIVVSALAPYIPEKPYFRMLRFLRLIKTAPTALCPECGTLVNRRLVRLTGRCSECGALLVKLPDESVDSRDLPDWRKVKKLHNFSISILPVTWVAACTLIFTGNAQWCAAVLIMAITAGIYSLRLRKKLKIHRACPGCGFNHWMVRDTTLLVKFGRCPVCRKQLVQYPDDEV